MRAIHNGRTDSNYGKALLHPKCYNFVIATYATYIQLYIIPRLKCSKFEIIVYINKYPKNVSHRNTETGK